jgi:hypothetical protein
MIPSGLARILAALKQIDAAGIPSGCDGCTFELRHDERGYPPKLSFRPLVRIPFGRTLPSAAFSGGNETNGYLRRLGSGSKQRNICICDPSNNAPGLFRKRTRSSPGRAADVRIGGGAQ